MACLRKLFIVTLVLTLLTCSAVSLSWDDTSDADDAASYDAEVTPFTFPECKGIPVMNALKGAEKTIDISIYLLTSTNAMALLIEKQTQGVQVRLLIEGQPAKNDADFDLASITSTKMMANLVNAGGEVHVINYEGCTEKNYSYLHNKYAVIDGETVIVTSENWTVGNFEGTSTNRGWGAVIKSKEYASSMESLFVGDFTITSERKDVAQFSDAFPSVSAYTGRISYSIGSYETGTYSAKVTPVWAPENAWDQLATFMLSASEKLYCEQLDLDDSYLESTYSPYTWMLNRANLGVDTRLVLNTSYDTAESHPLADKVKDINDNTPIVASGSPDDEKISLVHNKGAISDDKVWLGSLNWTPTSMVENREVCVIIQSQDVSDYFEEYLLVDLYEGYAQGGNKEVCYVTYDVDGTKTQLTYIKGDVVLLPDEPTKDSHSIYYYTFSHWKNYEKCMTAEEDVTLTAVFDEHTVLEDYSLFSYAVAALGVLAAVSLCYWYVRHR